MKNKFPVNMFKIIFSTHLFHQAICSSLILGSHEASYYPEQELIHFPEWFTSTMTPYVNGTDTQIPGDDYTPDYRIEEPPFFAYNYYNYIREELRPYRISPHYKQTSYWPGTNGASQFACYCTTVYRRVHLLAGCAVLTTRHILTTATSTEHILRFHRHAETLEEILGAWYDQNGNDWNSSMYMTPSRIHYHPKYVPLSDVNASHPIPCMYDLSVWASTFKFPGSTFNHNRVVTCCQRAASGFWFYFSTMSLPGDLGIVIGFQFIKAYRRVPMPWYKYAVRTRQHVQPCPKTEWGWFHCIMGDWASLGLDSGGAYHMAFEGKSWRSDGLAGINAFSMKLRSLQMTHYFTVLDTYPVLDFLYDAFLGKQKYEFLDHRFFNSRWMAPRVKPWFTVEASYPVGDAGYYYALPYYR